MPERTLRQYLEDTRMPAHVPRIILNKQRELIPQIVDSLFVAYVSGALTGVSEELKERYVKTKETVERHEGFAYVPHIHGTDPVKHPDVTPRDVRDIDEFWSVSVPDFQITWVEPPALGSGIEAGWGEKSREVPIVALCPADKRASRLMRGLRNYCKEIPYETLDDAYSKLDRLVQGLQDWVIEASSLWETIRTPLSTSRVPVRYFFDRRAYGRQLAEELAGRVATVGIEEANILATEMETLLRRYAQ